MSIPLRPIWIVSVIIVAISMLWYLFGTTAFFQRNIDLVMTVVYVFVWFPAFLYVAVSLVCIAKGFFPVTPARQTVLAIFVMLVAFVFFFSLFVPVFTRGYVAGWLTESVVRDSIQTTSDLKYEYHLVLINVFQRNSRARLHIKNILTGVETYIPLDMHTREIRWFTTPRSGHLEEENLWRAWTRMYPTDDENIYILTTRETLARGRALEVFEINTATGTARRLE